MKKITSLFTALTISAVSSVAMATGWEDDWSTSDVFVGLEGGYSKTKVKVDGVSGSDKSDNTGFFGLRLGSSWEDEARAYFTLGYNKPKDAHWSDSEQVKNIKQLNLLISADYMFMPEWDLQPFVGLTIGATETKADNFKKKWGFAYGAQAGVIYQIDNVDLEAGLKYLTNSSDHRWHNSDHDWKLKVNDSRQFYVAASIHF